MTMHDSLDAQDILRHLETRWVGKRIEVREQTGSTNDDASALARSGAPRGTVVLSDYQSAGRGRRGRPWNAPPGTAVLLSLVLRPALESRALGRIGMAGALAIVDAIHRCCGLNAAVKYPNDVLLEGRKVAGVLAESHLVGGCIDWAVLGVGVNVLRAAAPPDAVFPATSIEEHAPPPDRNRLVAILLERLEWRLDQAEDDPEGLAATWRAADTVLNQQVTVNLGRLRLQGLAADVDIDGRLLLRLPDGTERRLVPGEVSLRA